MSHNQWMGTFCFIAILFMNETCPKWTIRLGEIHRKGETKRIKILVYLLNNSVYKRYVEERSHGLLYFIGLKITCLGKNIPHYHFKVI